MDLTPYLAELRDQIAATADTVGPDAEAMADRFAAAVNAAARLAMLELLSAAAAEVTREIAPGSVEVRLRGRDPELVVVPAPPSVAASPDADTVVMNTDDATISRINVRLPQELKARVEDAARTSGISVNAWLVRAAATALPGTSTSPSSRGRASHGSDRYSGWVR